MAEGTRVVGILALVAALGGCAAAQQQVAETKARGTIEAGGYTWAIPMETEGANRIRTNGLPSRQAAAEAATILCKKHGRVAQFVKQGGSLLLGFAEFEHNCVK